MHTGFVCFLFQYDSFETNFIFSTSYPEENHIISQSDMLEELQTLVFT